MNATVFTAAPGVIFRETNPCRWTVIVDGQEERTITKDGASFIAWIGHQSRHWCLQRALDACAEDARYRRRLAEESARKHDEAIASLMAMTPEQKTRAVDLLEAERDLLDYDDTHVDIVARKAEIGRQIASMQANSLKKKRVA